LIGIGGSICCGITIISLIIRTQGILDVLDGGQWFVVNILGHVVDIASRIRCVEVFDSPSLRTRLVNDDL
jgi:hypothetical protein